MGLTVSIGGGNTVQAAATTTTTTKMIYFEALFDFLRHISQ
jgi:hypothetical protein